MDQQQLFFIAIVLIVLWMLMGHSSSCDCSKCRTMMPGHIRYGDGTIATGPPERIRYSCADDPANCGGAQRIRMNSDKYFGATQHIQHHLRHDNRSKLMNGIFSGTPQHIRNGENNCGADQNSPCTL